MTSKKKTFPCGHRGKGRFCHRCQAEERRRAQAGRDKDAWRARLAQAPFDASRLPREAAEHALRVWEELQAGKPWRALNGKRLKTMGQHHTIALPIGRRYRMVCREGPDGLACIEVISHETYNNRIASGGWS